MDKSNYTAKLLETLHYAEEEAKALKHNFVSEEHLVLAMLKNGQNLGFALIEECGANYGAAKKKVIEWLGSSI